MPLKFTPNANIVHTPTREEADAVFTPYAIEMGRLVYAWNHLHDDLAKLFWRVTGIRKSETAYAIWHSTPSDLGQRKMLIAAASTAFAKNDPAKSAILWLVGQVNNSLAAKRNDAIHGPVVLVTDLYGTSVRPDDWTNNPRASSLRGKQILSELVWYRETAECLRLYCRALERALSSPGQAGSLPEKPTLPHHRPLKSLREIRSHKRGKERSFQLQSSHMGKTPDSA
jgi:hypothetical protein